MRTYYLGIMPFSGDSAIHSGIKGQKWGVRRYQNPDGTYTELGKSRRRTGGEIIRSAASKIGSAMRSAGEKARALGERAKEAHHQRQIKGKKGYKYMTDEELTEHINRINMETRYREAVNQYNNTSRFKRAVKDIAENAAKTAVNTLVNRGLNNWLDERAADRKEEREQRNKIDVGDLLKNPKKYSKQQIRDAAEMEENLAKIRKSLGEKNDKDKLSPSERARRMLENPDDWSDEELANAAKRQENLNKIGGGSKGNGGGKGKGNGGGNPSNDSISSNNQNDTAERNSVRSNDDKWTMGGRDSSNDIAKPQQKVTPKPSGGSATQAQKQEPDYWDRIRNTSAQLTEESPATRAAQEWVSRQIRRNQNAHLTRGYINTPMPVRGGDRNQSARTTSGTWVPGRISAPDYSSSTSSRSDSESVKKKKNKK